MQLDAVAGDRGLVDGGCYVELAVPILTEQREGEDHCCDTGRARSSVS